MDYHPDFANHPDDGAHHLVTAVRDYFHERRGSPDRRQSVHWDLIKMLLDGGIPVPMSPLGCRPFSVYRAYCSADPVGMAISHYCIPMLELFASHGLDFSMVSYQLADLKWGNEGTKEMILYLEEHGARQSGDDETGLVAAIQASVSEEMIEFLLPRVRQGATPVMRYAVQMPLNACAAVQNEQLAIKLLEQGFKLSATYLFTSWVRNSKNQKLKELAGMP
jgi:hypothetical protein